MTTRQFPLRLLVIVIAIALVGRVLLLASGRVSFHSDEAVVALMARHILDGARPVFFYGQAYMGSLDAWLVAVGFRLLGESVGTIRIVQAVLYLLVVATGFAAAWRISGRATVAAVAALTYAVSPVLVAVYTAATLGGYNETLIFGNLLVLLGYSVMHGQRRSWWRWLALGVVGGLAWWTNGLIVAYAAPIGLLVLWRVVKPIAPPQTADDAAGTSPAASTAQRTERRAGWIGLGLALAGFSIGSAPWWVFNFEHDWAALAFYVAIGEEAGGEFAGNEVPSLTFDWRVLGLVFLGLPTLIGMRFPWADWFFAPLVGAVLVFIYGLAWWRLARGRVRADPPDMRLFLFGMVGIFCGLFFVSKFSIDPTGRYFLPLMFPFGVALGTLVDSMPSRWLQGATVALVLGYFAAGQVAAGGGELGFTTQFNPVSHIPNNYDDALIAWLDEHAIYAGYSTYWVTFRLAFLSDERMQFSSALPYKPNLEYTAADERYPAYKAAADASERAAYITANVEEVRAAMLRYFAAEGITYATAQVGPYFIYYDFSPRVPRPPLPLAAYAESE